MSAIEEFGLTSDPFAITVSDVSVHRWAGREHEKKILLDVVDSVRVSDIGSSEFVIVHGDYGAGKSHALPPNVIDAELANKILDLQT
ncbi:ATP-binding protein [Burkholderia cepacia]|uniref:ATP-binding protein n=1 Tax=Burkholderia cepacia TaxID=292 RepID=UPI0012DA371B|nr:ATP-binding protein [Burkholderia cepacia]